jgi:hypothetical protein
MPKTNLRKLAQAAPKFLPPLLDARGVEVKAVSFLVTSDMLDALDSIAARYSVRRSQLLATAVDEFRVKVTRKRKEPAVIVPDQLVVDAVQASA